MKEAKLRVKFIDEPHKKNPFYGDFHHVYTIEDTIMSDTNSNPNLPPCGVFCHFHLEYYNIVIKIDRGYFDGMSDGWAYVSFIRDTSAYEVACLFEGEKLVKVELHEWDEVGAFEDGDQANQAYVAESDDSQSPYYATEYN